MGRKLVNFSSERILALDAARGTAMLFVCISHFVEIYAGNSWVVIRGVFLVTMVASPAFMVINGLIHGFFYVKYGDRFDRIMANLINRGIFLLTLGRLLISLAHVVRSGGFLESLKWVFITDTIACNLILGPFLIRLIRPFGRLCLGVACVVGTWIAVLWWLPESGLGKGVKEMTVGSLEYSVFHYAFPLLPWFGLYLISTTIGEGLGHVALELRDPGQFVRHLFAVGGACIVVGLLAKPVMSSCTTWFFPSAINPMINRTYALTGG